MSKGIQLSVNPVVEAITVSGKATGADPSPNGVTINFLPEGGESKGEIDMNEMDAMFVDSARIVVINQQGSASLLQRKLKLGYNRAGRIVDQLESMGIIGPFQGSKARDVLFPDIESLDELLRTKGLI